MIGKKFCMVCEEEIPRDSVFCPKCGAELKKTGERETNLEKNNGAGPYGQKNAPNKINGKVIVAVVIGVILLVSIASFFMSPNPPGTETYDNKINAQEYYAEGVSLYEQGKYNQALEKFENALEIDPTYTEAWIYKGLTLDDFKRYSEALVCYDKAIALDPNNIISWYNKGIILGNQGYYEDSITCFDKVIAINPNDAEAWYNKGIALEFLGRKTEAQVCYEKAVQLGYAE